jgi:hypothetical protein
LIDNLVMASLAIKSISLCALKYRLSLEAERRLYFTDKKFISPLKYNDSSSPIAYALSVIQYE